MDDYPKILQHIMDLKRKEIVQKSLVHSTDDLELQLKSRKKFRGFHNVLKQCIETHRLCVVGNILRSAYCCVHPPETFDAAGQARAFVKQGVHAISVATDETFYHGKDEDVQSVSEMVDLPILRKEFIIDPYQVLETAVFGADCIILKAMCLEHVKLYHLSKLAHDIGLDVIVEIHSIEDLDKLVDLPIRMVNINNQNIETNKIDIATSMDLAGQLPSDYIIFSENGIANEGDVEILLAGGVNGIFVEACNENESPEVVFDRLFPKRTDNGLIEHAIS